MRRNSSIRIIIAAILLAATASLASARDYAPKVDKKTLPRIIVTTDLEVDDMNGVLLTLMYADQYDLAGLVWTAGMFHFNGDGVHTLAEITPHFRCEATTCGGLVENAGQLKEFRPVDPGWLERTVKDKYAHDYVFLSRNNPNYPSPEEVMAITKAGNIEFEGDYRFDTDGSRLIADCIMDEDMRPLYIQHWGGINTTVRALYSIYEKYHGTPEWDSVLAKVTEKVRLVGSGEDNCRKDSGIDEMFPGLKDGDRQSFGGYGQYFSASDGRMGAAAELKPYYKADYLCEAFKFGHGRLMSEFHLMNDGLVIYGEPLCYQYGLSTVIDWAEAGRQGWGSNAVTSFPKVELNSYDWMCCQFGCASFIDIGLRQGITNRDNHFVALLFDELAARADWAVMDPEDCNHAPVISRGELDFTARAGKSVALSTVAEDPDGDVLTYTWTVPAASCSYKDGKAESLAPDSVSGNEAAFTVPKDAKAGDRFVINCEVRDQGPERPMSRFAQFTITVI